LPQPRPGFRNGIRPGEADGVKSLFVGRAGDEGF